MYYLFLGMISVIFIVVFCLVASIFVLMLADLISIAWGNVVEVMRDLLDPIGEWIRKTILSE